MGSTTSIRKAGMTASGAVVPSRFVKDPALQQPTDATKPMETMIMTSATVMGGLTLLAERLREWPWQG